MIRHNCNHNSYFSTYVMKTNAITVPVPSLNFTRSSDVPGFQTRLYVRASRALQTFNFKPYR